MFIGVRAKVDIKANEVMGLYGGLAYTGLEAQARCRCVLYILCLYILSPLMYVQDARDRSWRVPGLGRILQSATG